jgi:hypothetical protein
VPPFDSTMISGVNVFAFSGVIPAIAVPPMSAKSNISVGTFTTSAVSVDVNAGGQVNNGGTSPPPALAGTVNGPIAVASNGRAVLSTTVNGVTNTYILYLDDLNDGDMMGTDNIVNVGFFTGRGPTSKFDNAHIAGTYVIGTDPPVLATVPNGVSPLTLTPNGACTATCSGTFSAGSSTGNYSFVPGTGRGTALATSGKINQNNTNAVFYIITPGLMVIMGDDQGVTSDALAFIQF